jgi:hypothetical protein
VSGEALDERLLRVLSFDSDVFDEVAADPRQTGPALAVVFAVAIATGLGRFPGAGLRGLLLGALETTLVWVLWLLLLHAALLGLGRGDRLAPLLRAFGFAALPFGAALFAGLPLLGGLAVLAKWVFAFGAAWRATQQVGELALPEAGVLCFSTLFGALWISSLALSVFVP